MMIRKNNLFTVQMLFFRETKGTVFWLRFQIIDLGWFGSTTMDVVDWIDFFGLLQVFGDGG